VAFAASKKAASGDAGSAGATGKDKMFIKTAAESDQTEIAMAKIALNKSSNADVKQFAQMMVDEHGRSTSSLTPIAQKAGVTLPPPMLAKHKMMAAKLETLSGDAFDKAYVTANVKAHQETATKMQANMGSITDPDLKAFAQQTLPVVQNHLKMAQDMQTKMGGSTSKAKAKKS
jgi:predicted outer membrane protein